MEKGLSSFIRESFEIDKKDYNTYSPLTLAYIGDAVFDIVIRTAVVSAGNTRADRLHRRTSAIVKAKKCQISYYGKERYSIRLQEGYRP